MNLAARESSATQEASVFDPWSEDVGRNAVLDELFDSLGDLGTLARRQFSLIASLEARFVWRDDDCVDMVQWIAINLGIGSHRARRLTDCARAIGSLYIPGPSPPYELK